MSSQDENRPTTFGAIIEKRASLTPSHQSNVTSQFAGAPEDSISKHSSAEVPRSHTATPHTQPQVATYKPSVEAPLSSPNYPPSTTHDLEAGAMVLNSLLPAPTVGKTPSISVSQYSHDLTPTRQLSSASTTASSIASLTINQVDEKLVVNQVVTRPNLTMWPTQQDLRQRADEEQRKSSRNPFKRLSKRNKVILSITVALTVVGAAVGIGVGISRTYHGEVWAGTGRYVPVSVSSIYVTYG